MKKKINKFKDFINENVLYEYTKELMIDIRKKLQIIDKLNYYFDCEDKYGIKFYVNINKGELKDFPVYNSNISIREIYQKQYNGFEIDFIINDNNINRDKFLSLLAHEISHVWQCLSGEDKYIESFKKMYAIEDFKKLVIGYKLNFLNYIYMNFEHELDARINQIYDYYQFKNFDTYENMLDDFKNDGVYKDMIWLRNFDFKNHLSKYNKYYLLELTNQFNILYGINEIKVEQLQRYYDNWKIIFKNNSDKYIDIFKDTLKIVYLKESRKSINSEIDNYYETMNMCYFEPSLLEKLIKYDPDEEIRKMVEKFKKLSL